MPPVLGGAVEQTLYETALSIQNPQLSVISPWHPALKKEDTCDKFHHVKVSQQVQKSKKLFGPNLPPPLQNPRHPFYYQSGVSDILHKVAPNTIQVHNRPQFSPYFLRQFPEAKHILYMHNVLEDISPEFEQCIDKIDHFIFVSQFLKNQFLSFFPHALQKTSVIYNSVDTNHWHPNLKNTPKVQEIRDKYKLTEGQTLLYIGRIVPPKGVHLLLESFKQVKTKIPQAKLIIAGHSNIYQKNETPYGGKIKKQASQMGQSVIFTGHIPHQETPYFFAAADLTVLPTKYPEAFGKIIIESMATGTPVLASKQGGISEIITNNVTGTLLPISFNIELLTQSILSLLQNQRHLQQIGQNANHDVNHRFSQKMRIRHLQQFYHRFHQTSFPNGHPNSNRNDKLHELT